MMMMMMMMDQKLFVHCSTNIHSDRYCRRTLYEGHYRTPSEPMRGIRRSVASVILCVGPACVALRALKGKWHELSTPNSVHTDSMAVAKHALIRRSKG